MTTSPVMTNTEEVLAELEQQAEEFESVDQDAGVERRAIEHIRSLTERLAYIQRNFVGASFDWDGEGMCVLAIEISDQVPVTADFASVLDAAIAQEGAEHE